MKLFTMIDRSMKEQIINDLNTTEEEYDEGVDIDEREGKMADYECPIRSVSIDNIKDKYLYEDMKLKGEDLNEEHNKLAILKSIIYLNVWIEGEDKRDGTMVTKPIICNDEDGDYTLYDGFHRISAFKLLYENRELQKVKELLKKYPKIEKFISKGEFEIIDLSEVLSIDNQMEVNIKKLGFYQFCDKFRTNSDKEEEEKREELFQNMLENSKHITYEEFSNNVETESDLVLDDDETFETYINEAISIENEDDIDSMNRLDNSNKTIGFFKSIVDGEVIYYFRFAGFEGIYLNDERLGLKKSQKITKVKNI